MKSKLITILLTGLFLVALVMAAAEIKVTGKPSVLTKTDNTTSFTVANTGNETLNISVFLEDLVDSEDNIISFTLNPSQVENLALGEDAEIEVSYLEFPEDFELGTHEIPIEIKGVGPNSSLDLAETLKVESEWCEAGTRGNIRIRNLDDLTSDDEWEWTPLDEVTIEVEIENNGDEDLEIVVQMDLYDTEEKEFIGIDEGNDVEEDLEVEEGRREVVEFTIKVPVEVQDSRTRYVLYVKAFEDGDEDLRCGERTQEIEIERSSREFKVEKVEFPEFVSCGDIANVNLWLANIGRSDEDRVRLTARNANLGFEESREIRNFDFDDRPEQLSFSILIPDNVEEGSYPITFDIFYDYDRRDDEYDRDISNFFTKILLVQGNCLEEENLDAAIFATLESDAVAGEEMTVQVTVTNTGNRETTYTLSVNGFEDWASGLRVSENALTLDVGKSDDILVYLTPNEDASGENEFVIATTFDSESKEQRVIVNIEESETGIDLDLGFLSQNWYLWVIIAINVILIVVIIIVALSMSKKE